MFYPLPLIILLFLWLPLTSLQAETTAVEIVLSDRSAHYAQVVDSVQQNLTSSVPSSLALNIVESSDWDAQAASASKLIVTIGTQAARQVFLANPETDVLSVMISANAYALLRQSPAGAEARGGRSAILLDQPVYRYVNLIKKLLPDGNRVGLLLGENSQRMLAGLRRSGMRNTLQFEAVKLAPGDNVATAIKQIIKSSDIVLSLPDPVALSPENAKWLLYMAYQRSIPVIGFSQAYTKAGALASLYTSPDQIGREVVECIEEIGMTDRLQSKVRGPKYFAVAINPWVARSLQIETPDEGVISKWLQLQEKRKDDSN